MRFAGRDIRSANSFKNILGIFPKGWRVPLTYRRDGQIYDTMVRLRGVHHEGELAESMEEPQMQPGPKPAPNRKTANGEKMSKGRSARKTHRSIRPAGCPDPDRQVVSPSKPLPDGVKKRFEARPGFANYYYNKLNRDRVWKADLARGDFSSLSGPWSFSGDLVGGGAFSAEAGR